MKRLLFLFAMLHQMLYGYSYNDLLLKAQASIFPKIMMLDKFIETKTVNGKIVYMIAYEPDDISVAQRVKNLIEAQYGGRINGYPFEVVLRPYAELNEGVEATAFYALDSQKGVERLADTCKHNRIITFAYDIANLRRGLLLSLVVEKSTVVYLAKEQIKPYGIDFVDVLYQIVKFIDEE